VGLSWAGNRLLYSASLAGGAGVWSTDIGSSASQLVVPAAAWARISTTADGRTLYYARVGNEIWKSGSDGSHPEKMAQISSSDAAVTPDGTSLFFLSLSSGQQLPFAIDVAGGPPRQLAAMTALHGTLSASPDGKLVTFLSDSSGEQEQIVMKAEGGAPIARLKLPGSVPHWTPDGQGLAYVDRTGLAIWIQPIAGGTPHRLAAFPDRPILQFAFSPDGKQLAISRATTISDIVLLRGVR
jgi:Tol biopolymer transport system component